MTPFAPLQQSPLARPLPQTPMPSAAPPDLQQAQALALAARLSPQTNAAKNTFGAQPGGVGMGTVRPNPLLGKNPWVGGGVPGGGGIAPAAANLPGYYAATPSQLGRWTSPQSGSALG